MGDSADMIEWFVADYELLSKDNRTEAEKAIDDAWDDMMEDAKDAADEAYHP